jgi:5-methylcytosine-specific restriction endonuclease McrA
MRLEFMILVITGFLVINVYHDGKYLIMIKSWKKYYQMAFYGFLGLSLYIFVKKNPGEGHSLFKHAHSFVKYMPMDKNSGDILSPLLRFSSHTSSIGDNTSTPQYKRMLNSGGSQGSNTKRSVSETKKKFVASRQNWKCKGCNCQLPAWFEVDHKVRLDRGGDNQINNLEALCPNCHREKTATENI